MMKMEEPSTSPLPSPHWLPYTLADAARGRNAPIKEPRLGDWIAPD